MLDVSWATLATEFLLAITVKLPKVARETVCLKQYVNCCF